jgi:transcriptional regulator with XRE-family HTH domain
MKKPTQETFGQRLARWRTERGIGQRELGRRSGISGTLISQLETGHTANPRLDTIEALAAALGLAPASLIADLRPIRAKKNGARGIGPVTYWADEKAAAPKSDGIDTR